MRADTLSHPFWSPQEVESALRPALEVNGAPQGARLSHRNRLRVGGAIDRDSVAALIRLKRRPTETLPAARRRHGFARPPRSPHAELRRHSWPATGRARSPSCSPGASPGVGGSARPRRGRGGAVGEPPGHGSAYPGPRRGDHLHQRQPARFPGDDAQEIWPSGPRPWRAGPPLHGGRLAPSPPSTVVDCMGRHPCVIRPGAIAARVLRESVPTLIGDADSCGCSSSAPATPVVARWPRPSRPSPTTGLSDLEPASAGTSAWVGASASDGALLWDWRGLDLNAHRSRQLDRDLVQQADLILAMGPDHLERLAGAAQRLMRSRWCGPMARMRSACCTGRGRAGASGAR